MRKNGCLLFYWMQQAQRAEDNHALETAIELANEIGVPPVVIFVLDPHYPHGNLRNYTFMLQGLRETARRLRQRGVGLITLFGDPTVKIPQAVKKWHASALITDRAYLRRARQWRTDIAAAIPVMMSEVDSDCVIPCTEFPHEEYAARTLRIKYRRQLPDWLHPVVPGQPHCQPPADLPQEFNPDDIVATLKLCKTDSSVTPVKTIFGGITAAKSLLDDFIAQQLPDYHQLHQNAAINSGSHLSPYLHYGQISPLHIALAIRQATGITDLSQGSFLDELLIRRELSINFVWYNQQYDQPAGWPTWGRSTVQEHQHDAKLAIYSREELAAGETDDIIWNAAQKELLCSGIIHNYPRMLWGKKLLEWSNTPEEAWDTAVWLNDRFALDGRDPNSYAGIAWCLAGKHDRPWFTRPIYGSVRYMSTARAGNHFPVTGYLERVNALCEKAGIAPVR